MTFTITRVANGWVLVYPDVEIDDETETVREIHRTFVFEDALDNEKPEAESLRNLLWEGFESYFQSKWEGGLTIENHAKGRECDGYEYEDFED